MSKFHLLVCLGNLCHCLFCAVGNCADHSLHRLLPCRLAKAEPELLRIAKRFGLEDAVVLSEFKAWLRSGDDLRAKYLFPEHVFRPSIIPSSSPLDWWQDNGHLLPALQQVALFMLTICPHAAGAERTWSLNSTEPPTCAFKRLLAICSRARLWAPPPFFQVSPQNA